MQAGNPVARGIPVTRSIVEPSRSTSATRRQHPSGPTAQPVLLRRPGQPVRTAIPEPVRKQSGTTSRSRKKTKTLINSITLEDGADAKAVAEARHVTIWNRVECRKIAGNAAPLRRNLVRYLAANPDCEEYKDQDKRPGNQNPENKHVPIWNKVENRKVTGNAAPLRKNLIAYLAKHPDCEEYIGQDKMPASARNPTFRTTSNNFSNPAGTATPFVTNNPAPHVSFLQSLPESAHRCTAHNNNNIGNTSELTYKELVSSWSNIPLWSWNAHGNGAGGGTTGVGTSTNTHAMATSPCETNSRGIPIAGSSTIAILPHDDMDLLMTGTSAGAAANSFNAEMNELDLSIFLNNTPRSVGQPEPMDFSPSAFLRSSPQPNHPSLLAMRSNNANHHR